MNMIVARISATEGLFGWHLLGLDMFGCRTKAALCRHQNLQCSERPRPLHTPSWCHSCRASILAVVHFPWESKVENISKHKSMGQNPKRIKTVLSERITVAIPRASRAVHCSRRCWGPVPWLRRVAPWAEQKRLRCVVSSFFLCVPRSQDEICTYVAHLWSMSSTAIDSEVIILPWPSIREASEAAPCICGTTSPLPPCGRPASTWTSVSKAYFKK